MGHFKNAIILDGGIMIVRIIKEDHYHLDQPTINYVMIRFSKFVIPGKWAGKLSSRAHNLTYCQPSFETSKPE